MFSNPFGRAGGGFDAGIEADVVRDELRRDLANRHHLDGAGSHSKRPLLWAGAAVVVAVVLGLWLA